ncbi:MAG: PD40 domain-containing protein [Planctomycetaceae bacterium]|nr:PD40 domain-containing protein [Planctomycetaceae bacterium]
MVSIRERNLMRRLVTGILGVVVLCGCADDRRGRNDSYVNGGSYVGCRPSIGLEQNSVLLSTPTIGNGDLLLLDLTTRGITNLTLSDEYEGDAVFSPNYNRIAFVREINSRGSIWTMNADGTDKRQHTFDDYYNHSPTYLTPHEVVYCKEGGQFGDRRDHLWVVDTRSNEGRPLSAKSLQGNSPDVALERFVAFARFLDGRLEVLLWDIKEQTLSSLGEGSGPAFSPDGSRLVVVASKLGDFQYDLCMIDLHSKKRTWITDTGGYKAYPSWPADNHIFYLDSTGTRELGKIVRVSLDNFSIEVLHNLEERTMSKPDLDK